jgi:hypothetical protein
VMSGGGAAEGREVASGRRARLAESPGGHVGQPDVSSAVVALAGDEQRVEQLVVVVFDLSGIAVHALVWLDQGLAVI